MTIPQTICKIKGHRAVKFFGCEFKSNAKTQEYTIYEFGTNIIHAVIKKEFVDYIYREFLKDPMEEGSF